MSVAQFKTRGLKLIDQVQLTREQIVIMKNGRPVTKFVASEDPAEDTFNCMKGDVEIAGDIVSPAMPTEDWRMFLDFSG